MDKTNVKVKFQEAWNLCREVTDQLALIGAADEKSLPIPVEYYRSLDLKSQSLISYVKDLLDYAENRDDK